MNPTIKTYTCDACGEEFIIRNPPEDKELWTCPWCCVTGVWLNDPPVKEKLKPCTHSGLTGEAMCVECRLALSDDDGRAFDHEGELLQRVQKSWAKRWAKRWGREWQA